MCMISLIVFTDKYQGNVWTFYTNGFSLHSNYGYYSFYGSFPFWKSTVLGEWWVDGEKAILRIA